MSQFETARQAKTLHRADILARPNVVGVGVGYKTQNQDSTGEMGVVVLVRRKLPRAALSAAALVPQELSGVRTDVIEVGDLRPLAQMNLDVPAGLHPESPAAHQRRWRPAPGGVSIGHYKITAGTLGAVVRDRQTGQRLILSNNHVLANSNNARPGDPILQPGPADGGRPDRDRIAILARFYPLGYTVAPATCQYAQSYARFGNLLARVTGSQHQLQALKVQTGAYSLIDAALARPLEEHFVTEEYLGLGTVNGHTHASPGMAVSKSGRTTALTSGTVRVVEATITIQYDLTTAITFEDQIMTTPMSQGGDSGSLLIKSDTLQAVGLLFAGSDQATLHNPIQQVMDLLQVDIPAAPADGNRKALERAERVRTIYQNLLLSKANVVDVNLGLRHTNGRRTDQLGLVVTVQHKLPKHLLSPADIIPSEIDGVPVDVRPL